MRQTTITVLRHAGAIALLGGVAVVAGATHGTASEPATSAASSIQCPQARATERAPDSYYVRVNPLPATAEHLERGRRLYEHDARPACQRCHGPDGDGNGPAAVDLEPRPRNFTCTVTMASIPDGQLFWVIENGSGDFHLPSRQGAQQVERPARGRPTTAMRGYGDHLSETDIWQLVLYIRTLATQPSAPATPTPPTETTTTTPESTR
jgi:Cytochrome c553